MQSEEGVRALITDTEHELRELDEEYSKLPHSAVRAEEYQLEVHTKLVTIHALRWVLGDWARP
jgi:hypothetical protein